MYMNYDIIRIHLLGKSFVELVKYLFTIDSVSSFLSQRLCQDPFDKDRGMVSIIIPVQRSLITTHRV